MIKALRVRSILEACVGKRRTDKLYRAMGIGSGLVIIITVIAITYTNLTNQRHGITVYGKYGGVINPASQFAYFSLLGLSCVSFVTYVTYSNKVKPILLRSGLIAAMFASWVGVNLLVTFYAHQPFFKTIADALALFCITASFIALIVFAENLMRHHKRH